LDNLSPTHRKARSIYLRCLSKIARIKWQDQIRNTTVLEHCQISGIETYLLAAHFRWTGHVIHMEDHQIPKRLYSQLTQGSQSCGGQFKRYKDSLKANLKSCGIPFAEQESRASDRPAWRTTCREALVAFEYNHINQLREKRLRRELQPTATADCFMCGKDRLLQCYSLLCQALITMLYRAYH